MMRESLICVCCPFKQEPGLTALHGITFKVQRLEDELRTQRILNRELLEMLNQVQNSLSGNMSKIFPGISSHPEKVGVGSSVFSKYPSLVYV